MSTGEKYRLQATELKKRYLDQYSDDRSHRESASKAIGDLCCGAYYTDNLTVVYLGCYVVLLSGYDTAIYERMH